MDRRPRPQPLASIELRRPRSPFRLRLLGEFAFERFSASLDVSAGAQRLLAFLALQGRPVLRQRVAGTFWPETNDGRAMANLRTMLWRLNRPDGQIVVANGDRIALAPDVAIDYQALAAFARSVIDGAPSEDRQVEELTNANDLLPDWSDDWLLAERERFRQLRLHALERLCGQLVVAGRYGRAVEVCLIAVASEPLRESAQRELMKVHLAEGNVTEAVRQFEAYRILLLDELGVEPSSEMTGLLGGRGVQLAPTIGRSVAPGRIGSQERGEDAALRASR